MVGPQLGWTSRLTRSKSDQFHFRKSAPGEHVNALRYGAPPHGALSCTASSCYAPYWAATCAVPPYANNRLFPAITFVSLQLELHLLMVHLLMVHLPMVHLHVLHLLAMHLIGLQLVQCIDTPTVVFRLQLIMHHCKPLGGSKQELEESK